MLALPQHRGVSLVAGLAGRQAAHRQRFGENMSEDNVWLQGRNEEIAALTAILHTIDSVHRQDGTIVPLRGAGAPQQRLDSPPGRRQKGAL